MKIRIELFTIFFLGFLVQPVAARNLIISIDGTNNDPGDAIERYEEETGLAVDSGISNVLKLHILAGGTLDNASTDPDQQAFYYVGVGNRGPIGTYKKLSAAMAITEPLLIIDAAYQDLVSNYQSGDKIYIFGFSRGAALARWLAQKISDEGLVREKIGLVHKPNIEFLGVWDTVAAFGGVNLGPNDLTSSSEVKESGRIAGVVRTAYHLVSVDDPRLAFRPVLMGAEDRVHEIWFPGVHSDVGGGYRADGLSDITLEFMLDKARHAGVRFRKPDEINYQRIAPISQQDLSIEPDVMGQLHLKTVIDDKAYVAWLQKRNWKKIMAPRKIYVAVADSVSDRPPLIHHSLLKRRKMMQASYNPPNLIELGDRYRILTEDGTILEP